MLEILRQAAWLSPTACRAQPTHPPLNEYQSVPNWAHTHEVISDDPLIGLSIRYMYVDDNSKALVGFISCIIAPL